MPIQKSKTPFRSARLTTPELAKASEDLVNYVQQEIESLVDKVNTAIAAISMPSVAVDTSSLEAQLATLQARLSVQQTLTASLSAQLALKANAGDLGDIADNNEVDFEAAGNVAAGIATHSADTDPHGDRAYADTELTTHVSDTDPHGDRAYADSNFVPLGEAVVDTTTLDALSVSNPPTQAEVQALQAEIASLFASLRVHS